MVNVLIRRFEPPLKLMVSPFAGTLRRLSITNTRSCRTFGRTVLRCLRSFRVVANPNWFPANICLSSTCSIDSKVANGKDLTCLINPF